MTDFKRSYSLPCSSIFSPIPICGPYLRYLIQTSKQFFYSILNNLRNISFVMLRGQITFNKIRQVQRRWKARSDWKQARKQALLKNALAAPQQHHFLHCKQCRLGICFFHQSKGESGVLNVFPNDANFKKWLLTAQSNFHEVTKWVLLKPRLTRSWKSEK